MRLLAILTIFSCCIISCNKEPLGVDAGMPFKKTCVTHTKVPSSHYTSSQASPVLVQEDNSCDLLPIDNNNYWIYRDSVFNGSGLLLSTRIDSVYYQRSYNMQGDDLIFWSRGSFDSTAASLQFRGGVYSTNDAVFITMGDMIQPDQFYTQRQYFIPVADSFVEPDYLISDYQFGPRVTRKNKTVETAIGRFSNALEIEFKNAGPRLLQYTEYFVPEIGIVKQERRNYGFVPVLGNVLRTVVKRELIRYKVD